MKKWLVRVGVGIGIMLLCVVAVVVLFHIQGKAQLAKKIAELKIQGLSTTFVELEAKYKLPEGTPNAADIYMKAFAAYHELPDEEKQEMLFNMGYLKDPMDKEPYSQGELAASAEFISLNQEMLDLLHQAGQIKECAYSLIVSDGNFSLGDASNGIKNARQTLFTAAMHYIETSQPQKAFECIIDQLRLADSLSRCSFLIGRLLQMEVISDDMPNLLRLFNRFNYTDAQLLELKSVLEQSEKKIGLKSAMEGEICAYINYGQNPSSDALGLSGDLTAGIRIVGMFTNNIVELIELHQRVLSIQQAPMEKQNEFCEALDEEICNLNFLHMLTVILSPPLGRCYQEYLQVKSEIYFVVTALAIERYRLKEKKLPETVEALVPGYLSGVYLDPFDGKPLRYKRTEPGYMVYTIGPDGVDDGGRERGPNERGENPDWVFRVYR